MSRLAETLRDSKRKDPKKTGRFTQIHTKRKFTRDDPHDSDDSPLIFLKIKNMPEASKARPPGQNQVQKLLKSSPRAPSGTVRRHKRATTFSRQHKPTAKIRCMVYFSCCFQASGSMSGSKVDRTCHCEGIQTNNKCSIPKISTLKSQSFLRSQPWPSQPGSWL